MIYDIRGQKANVVIIAKDAGEASKKKIIDKCNYFKVPYYVMFSKEDMMMLFNKNISSFGITDKNLALKFIENLNKGGCQDGK